MTLTSMASQLWQQGIASCTVVGKMPSGWRLSDLLLSRLVPCRRQITVLDTHDGLGIDDIAGLTDVSLCSSLALLSSCSAV